MTAIFVMIGVFMVGISGLCFLMYLGALYFFASSKDNKAPAGAHNEQARGAGKGHPPDLPEPSPPAGAT